MIHVGSTEHLTANANALDLLEAVASFTEFTTGDTGERNPVLERFHTAKDRHIFRILSTITTPTHSIQARVRAYDELPKRVKSLGDTAVRFVKGLVRKCSMGDFLNQEIVHDSILLAQEFGGQGDWELCRKFLRCIELATDYFPEVCGEAQCFLNLTELFLECRSSKDRGLDDILTRLTSILAKAALKRKFDNGAMDSNLRKDLLRFCRDGTPEQARHAVKILISITSVDAAGDRETLDSLLASLASPSILSVSTGGERLVTILAALSELSEAAPETVSSEKGQKAVRFAFESVLLGRGQPSDEMDASDVENDDENDNKQSKLGNSTTPQGKRNAKRKHLSPGVSTDLLDDINLSQTCRKLCAAIGFLTSFARSTIFASMKLRSHTSSDVHLKHPSSMEMIEKLFDTLSNIVRDEGMPPSSHDRKECSLRQDRSALRQCAAINLLRLCDARLSLDHRFLTPARWHILAGAFLDDERVVRDKIMEELGLMLTGHGKYGMHAYAGQAMIPRFHFLALVALCTDSEHSSANGNAANVGKRANTTKKNALQCVHELRKKYEVESEQARANGPEAEQNFEMHMKVRLMPEYVVPYAFHLLAFRKETPLKSGGSTGAQGADDDSSNYEDHEEFNESQERVLRKRLKWLFDPLVLSLGDTADNISFLIRMSDKIAGFTPVGHKSSTSLGDASATARLTVVCDIARMVLMSYVKKDVNLATFPGQILVPGSLFQKASLNKKKSGSSRAVPISRNTASTSLAAKLSQTGNNASKSDSASASQESFETAENSSPQNHLHAKRTSKNVSDNVHTKGKPSSPPSGTHVHFSPDVGTHEIHDTSSFGALSPIERKLSMDGSPRVFLDSGEKTRGSTPPSAVRNMAFTTTASVRSSATITESPSSRTSNRRRSLRSRSSARVETQKIEIRPSLQVATQQGATSLDQERSKRQLSTKDDPARMKKTRKSTVPTQIKVVRHRPLQDVASSRRVMRKRTSRETGGDFDFDVEDSVSANMVSKQTRSPKTKENSVQPQMRPTKRRTKI